GNRARWLGNTGDGCCFPSAGATPAGGVLRSRLGAWVRYRQDELIDVLTRRPDLWAVLDVTYPEPPPPGSPLYTLENVVLTPHIAGSRDAECRRMGRVAVEELRRYLHDQPLLWQITRERAALLA
ncbi:MAG: hypothetical protein M1118_00915, partial [Chloroflexi bacterium]|nr:hypothetical protein [Chloroflexota bacterium]